MIIQIMPSTSVHFPFFPKPSRSLPSSAEAHRTDGRAARGTEEAVAGRGDLPGGSLSVPQGAQGSELRSHWA